MLERGTSIRILTDKVDDYLMKEIIAITNAYQSRPIQIGCTDKFGDLDEMVIIFDNKHILRVNYNQDNILVANFSDEEHNVLVQELMC